AEQTRHLLQMGNLRQIADVAFDNGANIIEVPIAAPAPRASSDRFRVTAAQDGVPQFLADDGLRGRWWVTSECVVEELTGPIADFGNGKWQQIDDRHSACQRVGHSWKGKQIG